MRISLPKKTSLLIFLLFFLSLLSFSFLAIRINAQTNAVPEGGFVPCDQTSPVEYQSLRPYQASPCGDPPRAIICGNTVIVTVGKVSTPYCGSTTCPCVGNDCSKSFSDNRIVVDLTDVEVPFLGNTELALNSQSDSESLDDAEKMNEYVSWYLNGVNGRAEYPFLDVDNEEDIRKIVDFSGPVKKLLSWESQVAQRINTIESLSKTSPNTDEETGDVATGADRHNQIVGCVFGGIPVPCYGSLLDSVKDRKRIGDWKDHLPPLREDYDNFSDYYLAYRRWRGESCGKLTIPVINKDVMLCFNNPLKPDYWSSLFSYVPLSSMVDKRGVETVDHAQVTAPKATVADSDYIINKNAPLYFGHTQDNADLTAILRNTYLAKKEEGEDTSSSLQDFEQRDCKELSINTRSNPGDDATFNTPRSFFDVNVSYDISEVECESKTRTIKIRDADGNVIGTEVIEVWNCESEVYVEIPLTTKTPYARQIWEDTTVGPDSIFRRIFPKVGENSPVTCIADIPAVSKATYKLASESTNNVSLERVQNPGGGRTDPPEIYFPHLGTVYEYFLNGIQTALRPQGYGKPITDGTLCEPSEETGDCSFDLAKINQAIQKAASEYDIPSELLRAIFEIESYEWLYGGKPYICEENFAGAAGVAQIKKSTYDIVTCEGERMDDIGMCGEYSPKLSRCSIDDAFELMARVLLFSAGKWIYGPSNCAATGGLSLSNVSDWYNATCNYGTGLAPTEATINLSKDIPESERRQNGEMNYCDIVGWKLGIFPPYP